MGRPRDTNKYRLWKGGKLVPDHPYGITDDPKRRQTELKKQGLSNRQIANQMGVSPTTIKNWLEDYPYKR